MWDLPTPGTEPVSPALAVIPGWPYPLDHQGRPFSYILKPNLPIFAFRDTLPLSWIFSLHAGGPLGSHHVDLPLACSGHMAQILTPELLPQRQEASFMEQPRPHPLRLGPRLPAASPHTRFMQLGKLSSFPTFASCCINPCSQTSQPELSSFPAREHGSVELAFLLLKEVQDSIPE